MKKITILILSWASIIHSIYAQLPDHLEPAYSYLLNNSDISKNEINSEEPIQEYQALTNAENRNNQLGRALQFDTENSKLILPKLELPDLKNVSFPNVADIDESKGYTISFWVYFPHNLVNDQLTPIKRESPFVFEETDDSHQIFFGAKQNYTLPIGISRKRDRVVLNYLSNLSKPPKPWELWLWDSVSFVKDKWLQLFYVVRFNRGNIYIYDTAGNGNCRLNYFMAPDISEVTTWGFGSHNGIIKTNFILDDIKIWKRALTQEDIITIKCADGDFANTKFLNICPEISPTNRSDKEIFDATDIPAELEQNNTTNALQKQKAYTFEMKPNPASESVTIIMKIEKPFLMSFSFLTIEGKLLTTEEKTVDQTGEPISFDVSKLEEGFYIMRATGKDDISHSEKLIIKR